MIYGVEIKQTPWERIEKKEMERKYLLYISLTKLSINLVYKFIFGNKCIQQIKQV